MASFVLLDAEVVINGVDLSDHAQQVSLEYRGELQDETAMGDTTRKRLSGLKDWSLNVTFKSDFAAGKVDATLFSLIGGAAVTVTTMANKTAGVSATNPRFSGSAVLENYTPIGGQVGALATTAVVFRASGTLSRLTA